MNDLVGQAIAGYPLQKLLSKGAYDEVYQAASSGAPLAIRVLRAELRQDAALNAAVAKGWEAARALAHPGMVTVYSTGIERGVGAYSLEELPPGKPLRQMVIGGPKVAWRDCLVLAEQLFAALQALHAAKVCHSCIWSGAVLVTQDQDLKLENAGGLSLVERPLTAIVAGPAAGYLAPEIIQGSPVSPESDIYGAGACVYLIMAGQDPYSGEDAELLAKHVLARKPVPLSGLRDDTPPEAEEFISRLLAKDPVQRYGSAAGVLADVAQLKNGLPLLPLQGGRPAAPPRPSPQPSPPGGEGGVRGRASEPPATAAAEGAAGTAPLPGLVHGLASAVKAPASTRVVFGRLETHVKSTIPQSDIEKCGDDFYRQGQLPLALLTWKDAYLKGTPHAALKFKIDLAEIEVKKEAYGLSMEEARYRLGTGDFRNALSRAREALEAAQDEEQRQEALKLEREALLQQKEAAKARSIKRVLAAVGLVVLLILSLKLLNRGGNEGPEMVPPVPESGAGSKTEVPDKSKLAPQKYGSGEATVTLPPPWTLGAGQAQVMPPGATELAATLRITQCSAGTKSADRQNDLRKAQALANAQKCDDWDNIGAFIDGVYSCSELGFRYSAGDKFRYRYYYVVNGPGDSVYQAEFDGREDFFTPDLRAQMRQIILSLTYKK